MQKKESNLSLVYSVVKDKTWHRIEEFSMFPERRKAIEAINNLDRKYELEKLSEGKRLIAIKIK